MIQDPFGNFLMACKNCYFEKITPANSLHYSNANYQFLIKIAKELFEADKYEEFAGYLLEGQYFVALWAAHLLLEHGEPNNVLKVKALNTILDYSDNPLGPEVAEEEKLWLKKIELIINNKKLSS